MRKLKPSEIGPEAEAVKRMLIARYSVQAPLIAQRVYEKFQAELGVKNAITKSRR